MQAPRVVYGIHSATFYDPKTEIPYGTVRVLGNGQFTMEGETIELRGGSNRFPWSIQDGNINATIELTTKEYPDFLIDLFLGKKPTATTSATGKVSLPRAVKGTSILDATNGISAIAVKPTEKENLKFTKYTLVAVDANKFDLYAMSNIDFNRGDSVDFVDDTLKLTATPITVVVGANDIDGLGLSFTGVGVLAFTVGDSVTFEVSPVNNGESEAVVGGLSDVFKEFGVILMTQQLGSGEMFEIDVFRAKAIGLNLGSQEKAFSETPISAKAYYDADKGGICKIRAIKPA